MQIHVLNKILHRFKFGMWVTIVQKKKPTHFEPLGRGQKSKSVGFQHVLNVGFLHCLNKYYKNNRMMVLMVQETNKIIHYFQLTCYNSPSLDLGYSFLGKFTAPYKKGSFTGTIDLV